MPDDISNRTTASAKIATDGDQAHRINVMADSAEPVAITAAAPMRSIWRPI